MIGTLHAGRLERGTARHAGFSTSHGWRLRGQSHARRHASLARFLLSLSLCTIAIAVPAAAQTPPGEAQVGVTLEGWDERARLTILDRGGSFFGRTSDHGILQRFNPKLDDEYPIDLVSFSPSLSEDYEWYRRENGARFWAGSINHLQLVTRAQVQAAIPIGGAWSIDARFDHEESLEADRSLARLQLRRTLADSGLHLFANGTLKAQKTDIDVELGGTWLAGGTRVTLAFAALDLFNDFVYQDLGISESIADTLLDYSPHPYTARLAVGSALGEHVRVEGYALAMTPTEVVAESQRVPGAGFRQEERYGYAGALLEWRPEPGTAVGAFGTWIRARLGRTPLPDGAIEDDFELTERTERLGLYAIRSFHRRVLAEGWVAWVGRTQDRLRGQSTGLASEYYEDRAWEGRIDLTYRAAVGFRAIAALDFVARHVLGPDDVPGPRQERDHSRFRFDLGWRFGTRGQLMLGTNVDLDQDGGAATGAFDGAHGHLALYW